MEAHGHRRAVYKVAEEDCRVSQGGTDLQTVAAAAALEALMIRMLMERWRPYQWMVG